MAATPSRWSRCGIQPAICATSSKPCASPRPEENDHAICPSPRARLLPAAGGGRGRADLLYVARGNRRFQPGPNLDVVKANCAACHSADYVQTQPRGEKFKKDFWQTEVTKMIKVYGAPIDDADVPKIVEYLTATY